MGVTHGNAITYKPMSRPLGVIEPWSLQVAQDTSIPAFAVHFHASLFDPLDFDRHAIPEPDQIAQSVHRRRAEYFHGRLAGRAALANLGLQRATIPTGRFREPLWPEGVIGSISHNHQFAIACALPRKSWSAVGLDIETVQENALSAFSDVVIRDDEAAVLRRSDLPWSLAQQLTIAFSAKESFFKASFREVGRYFDFDAVAVHAVDASPRQLHLVLRQDLSPTLSEGDRFMVRFSILDPDTALTWCAW